MKPIRTPSPKESSYLAGKKIYNDGPMPPTELFKLVDFGLRNSDRWETLERATKAGWLAVLQDGNVDLTEVSCRHYDNEAATKPVVGKIATPRVNVNAGLPLSAKYRLNPRGLRPGAMDNSRAAMPSVYAKVTP